MEEIKLERTDYSLAQQAKGYAMSNTGNLTPLGQPFFYLGLAAVNALLSIACSLHVIAGNTQKVSIFVNDPKKEGGS